MDITLTQDDVQTLRGLVRDYLPELKFEAARADAGDIRHVLITRQTLCERLLDQLGDAPTPPLEARHD